MGVILEIVEDNGVEVVEVPVYSPDTIVITDAQDVTVVTEQTETVVIESLAGIQGEVGPIGPQGIQGEIGPANTLSIGTVDESDTTADAVITGTAPNQTLNLTLRRGAQGIQGIQGEAATISVGTVTTTAPGTNAGIVNVGTVNDAIFDFAFPRGDTGAQGPQGIQGVQGIQGATGPANTLTVGTVTSSDVAPDVIITGTAPNQTINFVLQRGPQGIQGIQGPKGDPGTGTVNSVNGDFGPDVVLTAAEVGAEPAITGGAVGQFWQGDKTWQAINKTTIGLANVDNTSDLSKPVSTATQTALNAKADLVGGLIPSSQLPPLAINDTFVVASQAAMLALTAQRGDMAIRTDTGTTFVLSTDSPGTLADWKEISSPGDVLSVNGQTGTVMITKTDVGLGNVDNTSDANKPISTATQTALNAKENTITAGTTAQYYRGDKSWQTLDKTAVGLANVDNTSDVNKPVSSATQTALNLKAPLASPTFTGTVSGITKTMVGLGNVDNTADTAKPISTATQTALDLKAPLASPTFTGSPAVPNLTITPSVGTAKGRFGGLQGVEAWTGMFENANFNGSAWVLDDTTKPGWFFKLDSRAIATEFAVYRIPAGANPHTDEAMMFKVDGTGLMTVTNRITGVANASGNTDALPKGQADTLYAKVVPIQASAPASDPNGTFWYDSDDVSADGYANVTRVLHNGTSYPARPTAAVYVEWVGPVAPTAYISGDTWVNTA